MTNLHTQTYHWQLRNIHTVHEISILYMKYGQRCTMYTWRKVKRNPQIKTCSNFQQPSEKAAKQRNKTNITYRSWRRINSFVAYHKSSKWWEGWIEMTKMVMQSTKNNIIINTSAEYFVALEDYCKMSWSKIPTMTGEIVCLII